MITFDIKDYELVLEAKILLVPEFKEIYELKGTPHAGSTYLVYIFYMTETGDTNPYANYNKAEKESLIKQMLFGENTYQFREDVKALIDKATEVYIELNNTEETQLLKSFKKKISELTNLVDSLDLSNIESYDKFINLLKSSKSMLAGLQELELKARKSLKEKARADAALSPLEKGTLDIEKIKKWNKIN